MPLVIPSRRHLVVDKASGIFAIAARAKNAIARHGAERVIDSTIGVGLSESGKPFVIPTFVSTMQELLEGKPEALCAYTPPAGAATLADAYANSILDGVPLPDGLVRKAIPTHGGTGGLTLSITNLASRTVISHAPYWENYALIAQQCGKELACFNLLDSALRFDAADFERVVKKVAAEEGRVCLLINSPYSNPTGAALEASEWDEIGRVLAGVSGDKVLILDLAYIDFGPRGRDPEDLAFVGKLFERVPDLHIVLVPSLSKSMMAYGWRSGAAILLTRDQDEATKWFDVMEGTIRGSNSNEVTAPQQALVAILSSETKRAQVAAERQHCNEIVQRRFLSFNEAAHDAGLKVSKPVGGYFAVVYVPDPLDVARKLEERDVYTVPVLEPGGLRIGLCALPLPKATRIVHEIAAILR